MTQGVSEGECRRLLGEKKGLSWQTAKDILLQPAKSLEQKGESRQDDWKKIKKEKGRYSIGKKNKQGGGKRSFQEHSRLSESPSSSGNGCIAYAGNGGGNFSSIRTDEKGGSFI